MCEQESTILTYYYYGNEGDGTIYEIIIFEKFCQRRVLHKIIMLLIIQIGNIRLNILWSYFFN